MQCPILKKLTNYCLGHAVICASAHHKDSKLTSLSLRFYQYSAPHAEMRQAQH